MSELAPAKLWGLGSNYGNVMDVIPSYVVLLSNSVKSRNISRSPGGHEAHTQINVYGIYTY